MSDIRLYRKFVCVSANSSADTTNNLFNPFGLSATTTTSSSSGGTIIESNLIPIQEYTGNYYVDLNPNLYSGDILYDLRWDVIYIPGAPLKTLISKFRIMPSINGSIMEIEIISSY